MNYAVLVNRNLYEYRLIKTLTIGFEMKLYSLIIVKTP
jgi:hypothetical protein